MPTVYSNFVQFKMNQNELVLEFSFFSPDRPGQGPPADLKPEVRVVMVAGALDLLLKGLEQGKAARDQQTAAQKPAMGLKT
jgi:hypothetical protein